jgi:hypothetical protein
VKTGDHVLLRELEAEALGVVVDILDLGKLEGNESLVTAGKGLLGLDTNGSGGLVHGRPAGEEVEASGSNTDGAGDEKRGWQAAALGLGSFGSIATGLLEVEFICQH